MRENIDEVHRLNTIFFLMIITSIYFRKSKILKESRSVKRCKVILLMPEFPLIWTLFTGRNYSL